MFQINQIKRSLDDYHIWITRFLLVCVITVFVIFEVGGVPAITGETATTFALCVFSYILYDVAINTHSPFHKLVYEDQSALIKDFYEILEKRKVRKAILIQYSGKRAIEFIHQLLNKGVEVTLWLSNPETAVSDEQQHKIIGQLKEMAGDVGLSRGKTKTHNGKLRVYLYNAPASIRGIMLDDDIIIVGWYTYEHIIAHSNNYPDDDYELSGHDRPYILLHRNSPGFIVLKNMFVNQCEDYMRHWESHGETEPRLELPSRIHSEQL